MKPAIAIIGVFIFLGCCVSAASQTRRIDSLKNLVIKSNYRDDRLQRLFAFCDERLSLNNDTLFAYATAAQQLAKSRHNDLLTIRAEYYLNYVLLKKGLFNSVITKCDYCIQWLQKNDGPSDLLYEFQFLKAQTFIRSNRYKEALSLTYQLLSNAENSGNTLMQIKAKNNIGWVNMEMNQDREALNWFYNALSTTNNQQLFDNYAALYSNLASTYNNIHKYDSATYFVNKALAGSRQSQHLTYLANSLYIQADIFANTKNNTGAEKALTEALSIRQQIGDPFYIVSDLSQLSYFYATTGQTAKGISLAEQGFEMATQYSITAKLPLLYKALAENYKAAGDYKTYSEVQEKVIALKDSLYQKNSAEAMRSLQAKYDLQRKENIIIQQQLKIIKKDYLLYGTLTLFGFLLLLIFILYRNYRKRQKIKMEKVLKEQQQRETIAIIKAEEAERKRIAADLHDNLGAYAAAISANVKSFKDEGDYNHQLTHRIEENVTGMVSQLSDTIWVLKKEHQLLTEVSDRFKVWMQRLMRNYPYTRYDFEEQIDDDLSLTPASALHLFYMMQECINNALKHSRCTQIIVQLKAKEQFLQIQVSDNGTGFHTNNAKGANGISNLRQRAAACNWKVHWKQNEPKGTVVSIGSD